MKKHKIVQGAYISIEAKNILEREAKRREVHPATLAAEILEKSAQKIHRKEPQTDETVPAQ